MVNGSCENKPASGETSRVFVIFLSCAMSVVVVSGCCVALSIGYHRLSYAVEYREEQHKEADPLRMPYRGQTE